MGSESAGRFRLGHQRSLDGFRGVSILIVIAVHGFLLGGSFGFIGVNLFFVLSGFLITSLLLQERHAHGKICISAFYARRALRLLPALLIMLSACLACSFLLTDGKGFRTHVRETFAALFYYMNWKMIYGSENVVLLRHTWSLSIEEQFYLIWPLLLVLLLRKGLTASVLSLTLLGAFMSWLTRALLYLGTTADLDRLYCGLDTRADSLLLGCAAAMWVALKPAPPRRVFEAFRWLAPVSAAVILALGVSFKMRSAFMFLLGWLLVSFCAATILLALVWQRGTPFHRFLEIPALTYIGRISYGLYLWHWPILRIIDGFSLPAAQSLPLYLALTLTVSAASFKWLETPFLRMKAKFARDSRANLPPLRTINSCAAH